ncbi:MAG: 30S ribosomal protein S9 [Candidatus Kerfeldbacteria bacterium]|nr:30S ribosomal protein S9 [Candidatus Kerfeldbacteria bacterium]
MTTAIKKSGVHKKKAPAKKKAEKKHVKKTPVKHPEHPVHVPVAKPKRKQTYLYAVGRRKQSVARVRFIIGDQTELFVNGKPLNAFFNNPSWQRIVQEPIIVANVQGLGSFSVQVSGGGTQGQAESVRLGIARVLLKHDENLKPLLRSHKLLTVDARVKERKKYGLKKARRAPQWQKR